MILRKAAAAILVSALTLAAAETVLRVGPVPESKVVRKVHPAYPADARDLKIQGEVRVQVMIGKDGRVEGAKLISGHPLLVPAALQAARKWTFQPFEQDGKRVRAIADLSFPFAPPPNIQ